MVDDLIAEARRWGRVELKDGKVLVEGRFPKTLVEELRCHKEEIRQALQLLARAEPVPPGYQPETDSSPPTFPCWNCRATSWWQRWDGAWVCGWCHPDPKALAEKWRTGQAPPPGGPF